MNITKKLISKIDQLLSFGLTKGLGQPKPGEMCVEAAIAYALGKEHTDKNYECVLPLLNKIKINLNDCNWSSNKARAEGMRSLAIAQLGSNTLDEAIFAEKLKEHLNKRLLPYLIQKHKKEFPNQAAIIEAIEKQYPAGSEELREALRDHYYDDNYYYYNYYDYYTHYYYNYNSFRDEWLLLVADTILDVLKEMKSPGCEWL